MPSTTFSLGIVRSIGTSNIEVTENGVTTTRSWPTEIARTVSVNLQAGGTLGGVNLINDRQIFVSNPINPPSGYAGNSEMLNPIFRMYLEPPANYTFMLWNTAAPTTIIASFKGVVSKTFAYGTAYDYVIRYQSGNGDYGHINIRE